MLGQKSIISKQNRDIGSLFGISNWHRFQNIRKIKQSKIIINISINIYFPLPMTELHNHSKNLRRKCSIQILWKCWAHWLPSNTLMETWTWMSTIIISTKHIIMTIYVDFNSYLIRENRNKSNMINVSMLKFC